MKTRLTVPTPRLWLSRFGVCLRPGICSKFIAAAIAVSSTKSGRTFPKDATIDAMFLQI
jgi:hypothetical protein